MRTSTSWAFRRIRSIAPFALALLWGCIGHHDVTLPLDQQQQAMTGNLDVGTATSGDNPDTDGYRVTIDEDRSQDVPSNGHTEFLDLPAGSYQVQLQEISTNCSVAGNPQTATVYAGSTSQITFVINC